MDAVLLISRLVLAAVFVVAAVAKTVDRAGARRALEQFGVPAAAVPAVALTLPALELAVAVALVPQATATGAAIAAAVLLAAFTAAVALALARGTEAECHCFGAVSANPVGPATLARNVALLALAGLAAAGGAGTSATGWIGDLSATEAVLASVSAALALGVAFNAAFLFQLFRQNGRLIAEIEALRDSAGPASDGLQVGQYVPAFELPDLSGVLVGLGDLLDGDRGLTLLFSAPDCGACESLLPDIGRHQRDPAADPLVLISYGDADRAAAKASEHGIDRVLVIEDFDLPRSMGVSGAPGAVVVDADGRLAAEPVLGGAGVGALIGLEPALPDLVRVEGAV